MIVTAIHCILREISSSQAGIHSLAFAHPRREHHATRLRPPQPQANRAASEPFKAESEVTSRATKA